MKRALILLTILFIGFSSCKKDEDNKVKGDLNVIVAINGYQSVEGADVYTNPKSEQGTTDEFGSVLLTGLEIGSYEVYASLQEVGSGKSVVNIKADELSEVIVSIVPGINVGLAPSINVIFPVEPAEFSDGDEITFSAEIEDDETPASEISVTWESDLDGVINTGSPDNTGYTTFTTNSLQRGLHEITLTAEDSDGYSSSKVIQVSTLAPKEIILNTPVKDEGKVNLSWSEYEGSDFLKYEVFRSDGNCSSQNHELIATISEKGTTSFTDELPPFEFEVCYYIRVSNTEGYSRNSNQEVVDMPSGYIFNFEPYDMLKHPDEPFIYLIDRSGQRIVKFNYQTLSVEGETNLQGNVGYCDIGDNGYGVEIYVPSSDGWIYVYDADNLSQTTSISTGLGTTSTVINGLGHVIAAVLPSPWWEQPVRTYMRSTGIHIDGNGDFDGDRLRMIPGKNEIISISTGVSPTDMEYFKLASTGHIELHADDPYHGDHPLNPRIFRISDDGTYSITAKEGAVYLANSSMEYKGQLQHGSLHFSDFAFSEDGSVIYAATSNRKSIQIGHYPSLIRDNEILTKGFPIFIIRDNDKIIALSKSTEGSINCGVEVIQL